MKEIIFVTGNQLKFESAQTVLRSYGIEPIQKTIDLPEIQALTTEEIAGHSAKEASNIFKANVVTSDVGYFIKALNGFPGPFLKQINSWFSAQDFLNLMKDKDNREVEIVETLAY